jgi:hypothetical protein
VTAVLLMVAVSGCGGGKDNGTIDGPQAGQVAARFHTLTGATLKPAGLDISKDIISTNYGKDPGDPQWKDDPGIKAYFAFMEKYYPEGDKLNTVNTYGYSVAELLAHVLRNCGDDLTRENLMRQVTSIKGYVPSLALPGISITTGPNDYRVNKQMQMMRFNGERWELFGPIIEDTGPAG